MNENQFFVEDIKKKNSNETGYLSILGKKIHTFSLYRIEPCIDFKRENRRENSMTKYVNNR